MKMEERQTYYYPSEEELIVEVQTRPLSSYFQSLKSGVRYEVKQISTLNPSCRLEIVLTTELNPSDLPWIMRSISGTIESLAHDAANQSMQKQIADMHTIASNHAREAEKGVIQSEVKKLASKTSILSEDEDEFFDAVDNLDELESPLLRRTSSRLDPHVHPISNKLEMDSVSRDSIQSLHGRIASLETTLNSTPEGRLLYQNSQQEGTLHNRINHYLQQLEVSNQQRIEEEKRREEAIDARLEQLERNLNRLILPTVTWGQRVGAAAFVVVWPFVAYKIWNLSKGLIFQKFLKN
eukprot:TRINITY_DN226_c0_g2_i3.p1 TRINITY_DN226_c0_g2~~TRINITY_DN226_c0_g2_i3.p1  ORF type:complete len:295 (-),score=107.99 TRINITY_DN226_c0_g2_i3:154-1038(-)